MRVAQRIMVAGCVLVVACGDPDPPSCTSAFDCPGAEVCVNGECVNGAIDAGQDAGQDGGQDAGRDAGGAEDAGTDTGDQDACAPIAEVCGDDGVDEDCDGLVDEGCECAEGEEEPCRGMSTGACDPGIRRCVGGMWSECEGVVGPSDEICNRLDDDCDTAIDEDTTGCEEPENTDARCSDGVDNDFNGFTDCEDFGCTRTPGVTVCDEDTAPLCSDGLDNDGDGLPDCADPDCDAVRDCSEASDLRCADEIDNDGDGFVDCMDFDCSRNPAVSVCDSENTNALCSDGIDNDRNGFADCEDFNCQRPPVTVCE